MTTLLDAFALIAFLRDEPAASEVEQALRTGDVGMTAVNLAEALDVLERVNGIPRRTLDELTIPLIAESVRIMGVDEPLARDAASVRARHYHRTRSPLSLADCIVVAAAREAVLATADRPLARAARTEGITVLALPDSRGRRP